MRMDDVVTPAYIVDEKALIHNLDILKKVEERSGAKILLAQKCFSMFYEYPLISKYISGCTASGLFEAKLGYEEMKKENHIFSPAYPEKDFDEIVRICDHIIFNSKTQLEKYRDKCAGKSFGLRINPMCSTQKDHAIYDPCAPGSRLGITIEEFRKIDLSGVEGLHFHTLCEQNADDLATTLRAVEEQFGSYLYDMKWLNMGGGHHITRDDYDRELLIKLVQDISAKYNVQVYLEPGEAVALNAGYLKTTVLDVVENSGVKTLILDASAACHMPDVLEMPYRPPLKDSGEAKEKAYNYVLSSYTCLAGDIIGEYSFDHAVGIGDTLYFEDMAIYSMVKNNTFNGIGLPSLVSMDSSGECRVVKTFGYEDFKMRLS